MNMITNFILPEDIELVKTQREELSEKVEVFNLYLKAHPKAIERVAGEIIDSVKVKKLNYFEIHDIESYLKPNLEVA